MRRPKLPAFIHDVVDDPHQRGILVAATLALFVVGLVPRVLSPGLPTAQVALRSQPEIQNLFLLLAFVSTATVILGGLVSDLFRRRSLLVGSLALIAIASTLAAVVDQGAVFYSANFVAVAAAGVVLAYAVGSVAVAYEGIPRATALGFVYAAFGAGAAASPALITLFPTLIPSDRPGVPSTFTFDTSLAYALTGLAALLALGAAWRYVPRMPGSLPASRRLVTALAVWSIAILAVVTGVLGLGGAGGELLPLLLIVGGSLVLSMLTLQFRRTRREVGSMRLDIRALGAALAVGVAVGFAQAIPLMLMPVVFEYPLRYGTLFAILAIAPFAIALLVAGPISGLLIRRFGPRGIITLGTFALGVANALLALVLATIVGVVRDFYQANPEVARVSLEGAHYLLFVLPLGLVGGGFVVATTVRTAIVFASTPRGLAASAAALNEASVSLGARIGIVAGTALLATTAVATARELATLWAPQAAAALLDEFELTLVSLGTPRFREVYAATLEGAEPIKAAAYSVAYMDGVVAALLLSAIAGVGGAVLAWILIGRRDPLHTVFEMQDERSRGPAPQATAADTKREP